VPKNVGDKVELYEFEKRSIVEKGMGLGSDGNVYISKKSLEHFKTVDNGGQSGLKKGEKGLGSSSKEGIKNKGANDNIIKPYTGPSTGYKSKVDVGDTKQFSTTQSWGYWAQYEKIIIDGKEYAKVGDWLYTRHAVENLYPSKMGRAPGHTSNHDHLNLPPKYINDILSNKNTRFKEVTKNGVNRRLFQSGDIEIVTEGNIVVTVKWVK
jgi:hypothetical protein